MQTGSWPRCVWTEHDNVKYWPDISLEMKFINHHRRLEDLRDGQTEQLILQRLSLNLTATKNIIQYSTL